ncbi:cell division protein FtsQ/DivIB [Trueperella sp. LYQ143]|uniref:cell division protein FtsQ/DivIB n=1 Tax=unclassified Trueperella TaxID=2630174 RepID=UPI0039834B20
MRAPRQPRKPQRLTPQSPAERLAGGEIESSRTPQPQDYIPTAAGEYSEWIDDEDDWEDEPSAPSVHPDYWQEHRARDLPAAGASTSDTLHETDNDSLRGAKRWLRGGFFSGDAQAHDDESAPDEGAVSDEPRRCAPWARWRRRFSVSGEQNSAADEVTRDTDEVAHDAELVRAESFSYAFAGDSQELSAHAQVETTSAVPEDSDKTGVSAWVHNLRSTWGRRFSKKGSSETISDEVAARRRERERERWRLRSKRVAILGGIVVFVGVLAWVLCASPLLRYHYHAEQISGYAENTIVNHTELEQILAQYDGESLVTLRGSSIEAEILEKIPEIAAVDVAKKYPSGMRVHITEEIPVACLTQDKTCIAVAGDGTQLRLSPDRANTLPHVEVAEGVDRTSGIAEALQVLRTISAPTRSRVTNVSVAKGNLMTLRLNEGQTVFWGGVERADFKARVLDALVTHPAHYYDVSVPDAPVSK